MSYLFLFQNAIQYQFSSVQSLSRVQLFAVQYILCLLIIFLKSHFGYDSFLDLGNIDSFEEFF